VAWLALCLWLPACGNPPQKKEAGRVVLFTSHDRIFSEPVVREFEGRTGVRVEMVTDTEAAKTVGLANRLIARREHPEADVFWNNEVGHTLVLREEGVLEAYRTRAAEGIPDGQRDRDGWWTGFAARGRVILYNTTLVKPEEAPRRLEDLTHARFQGRVAVARPLFGTTFTHAAVLFAELGPDKAKDFFRRLKRNGTLFVAGNALARDLVVRGERAVCLTDTDDAQGAFLKGAPVEMVYPDQDEGGCLLIPNSVALIRNGPNAENAKKLIEFLVSAEVEARLARSESAQIPLRPDVAPPSSRFDPRTFKALRPDWAAVSRQLPAVKAFVEAELLD
jgi:iron(III) transport system substrate-binding protein